MPWEPKRVKYWNITGLRLTYNIMREAKSSVIEDSLKHGFREILSSSWLSSKSSEVEKAGGPGVNSCPSYQKLHWRELFILQASLLKSHCRIIYEMSEECCGKKIRLTFKTILKHLSCKKSWRCGRSGLAGAWGRAEAFRGLGQRPGIASKLGGPGGLSQPLWGATRQRRHLCS